MLSPCEAALPTCAALPHPMVGLFVYRCPHRGQWVAWWTTGDTSQPATEPPMTWGPFDTAADVIAGVTARLAVQLAELLEEPSPQV